MGGEYVAVAASERPTPKSHRLCFFCVLGLSSVVLFGFLFATDEGGAYVSHIMKMVGLSRSPEELHTYSSTEPCVLPKLDPLDASILSYVNPNYDPMKNCKPTFVPLTRVRNGRVEVVPEFEFARHLTGCEFRCHYPQGDYKSRLGEWLNISLTPDCDVIEVRCRNAFGKITYEYAHTQIFANRTGVVAPSREPKNATIRPPDVHIIIFDSVSSAQLMRSMPKSLRFLEEELGAMNFRYLTKVAHNSRPNGYAMFLGRLHNASGDTDEWALCKKALDNEPFIGFEYQRRGYKTMMAEDYYQGWNWPGCKGFEKTHFDHYMKPFQLLYRASKENEAWQKKLFDDQCRGTHLYLFDYFKGFLDAYADEPKFSIMWPVDITHNEVNGLYPVDDIFLKMLKDYKAKLNNAFLFVMGDHGIRHTDIRSTKQGEIEDNNPALVMAVPERLRKNKQLMANLKLNSRQLMTHYDNHATWVNIARECDRMTSDSPFDRLDTCTWNVTLLGESYLYPFNLSKPRNCANLRVYSGYCICQNKVNNVTVEKQPLARRIATFLVGHINDFLQTKKMLDVCKELFVHPNRTVELLQLNVDEGMHRVTFRTQPNDAKYESHVRVSHEDNVGGSEAYSIVTNKINRLDSYEAQVKCTKDYEARPFCHCRTRLKN
ncbi:Protein K03A11.4 [Aphelenchoides avenae]|nr:Protein K03A11.4 [Aphelenchus avenae]